MATFRFYQDIKAQTWVRDYFKVEADSLEDAIKMILDSNKSLDELEGETENVKWECRDDAVTFDCLVESETFGIFSEDLDHRRQESLILFKEERNDEC